MEIAPALKALYLNGYRYLECREMGGHVDTARVYRNVSGVEMFMWREGNECLLASENVGALNFINDVINGAQAG